MVDKIEEIYEGTKEAIVNFRKKPVDNLGFLLPVAIALAALVSGIVTYILFIVRGGYAEQIGFFKEEGLGGVSDAFTGGTVGLIVSGISGKILLGMAAVEFVVMLVSYFKSSGKTKRILMIVDLGLLVVQSVLAATVIRAFFGDYGFGSSARAWYKSLFDGLSDVWRIVLITYAVLTLAAWITFVVLVMITRSSRGMVGYTLVSLLFAFAVVPLAFLILENIIPIVVFAFFIAIIVVIFKIIDSVSTGGTVDTGDTFVTRREMKGEIDRLEKKL